MCGRYSQTQSGEAIAVNFSLFESPVLAPQYNIAPTQQVSAILATAESPQPHHRQLRWGLIPGWAKDKTIGNRLINARAETVAEKPSFRSAFKRRRCLIVADGFYEWQRQEKQKQPFYIQLRDRAPFAFAGLWERWQDGASGEATYSCTILTTAPNTLMAPIHNRMPVILPAAAYEPWLDPDLTHGSSLNVLLRPFDADRMSSYPVSTHVNNPRHNDPGCLAPLS
ncbi:MAG: SOS response-associated peptidase [Cyanobacteria bacterium P01_C01_bin.73]